LNLPLHIPGVTLPLPPASPQFVDLSPATSAAAGSVRPVAGELADGLLASSAQLSPKFFYDELGSRLFEAITSLTEYYPTRTEAAIFEASRADMARALVDAGIRSPCLIDLGAGNCAKASSLMTALQPRQYVPVDISVEFLRDAASQVQNSFPALDIVGVGMDFSAGLRLPAEVQPNDRVFFYPGSSLGNFHPDDARGFLQHIADPAQGGARGLLLGIDLVKDSLTLEAAYADALGVTAAFNKNILLNVNRLLGSDFAVDQWQHVAFFDRALSRIEMHLEARMDLLVTWPGQRRRFRAGERIHTECSYKYTLDSMHTLLREAGFSQVQHWTDPKQWFAVFCATV